MLVLGRVVSGNSARDLFSPKRIWATRRPRKMVKAKLGMAPGEKNAAESWPGRTNGYVEI